MGVTRFDDAGKPLPKHHQEASMTQKSRSYLPNTPPESVAGSDNICPPGYPQQQTPEKNSLLFGVNSAEEWEICWQAISTYRSRSASVDQIDRRPSLAESVRHSFSRTPRKTQSLPVHPGYAYPQLENPMLGLHIPASIPPSRQREPTIDYTDDDNIQLQEQSQDSEAFAKVAINLQDDAAVLDRLRLMFNNFLQKELKDYLKAMIKLIEPNKQKKWPYYLGESEEKKAANFSTKRKLVGEDGLMQPPWWPKLVRYTEPDHLRRNENIDLSVEIMQWLMMDPSARGYSRFIVDGSNPPVSLSPVQFVLARKDNALANSFQQPSKQRGKVDLFRVSLASIWTLAQYYDECCLGNRDWEAPCYISDVSPTRQIITPVSRKAPKKKSPKKELSVRAKSDNPESKRRRCTLPESVSTSFNEQGQAPEAEEDKTSGQDTDDSRSDSTYVPSLQDSMDSLMIEQRDVKATPKINTRLAHTRIQLSRNQDQPSSSDMSPQVLPSPFQTQYHYVPSTMAYSANIITDFTTGGLTTVGELISIPPQMANPNLRVDYMGFPATIPSNYQFPQYQGIPISLDVSNTLLAHIPADESNAKANASYTPYQN